MQYDGALECLKTRRSVKAYTDELPSESILMQIAEAGMNAPTGRGMQSPVIVAVTCKAVRDRLSRLNAGILGTTSDPFYGAPAVFVVLADRNRPTYIYDGSLVMGNMMNAAHALGLGSCWIHRAKEIFDMPEGKSILADWGIEGDYEGIGFCITGYPAPGYEPKTAPRKSGYLHWVR